MKDFIQTRISWIHTWSALIVVCCQGTGGFQGRPSRSDSGRMTENADSQLSQPGSDLRAAGEYRRAEKRTRIRQVTVRLYTCNKTNGAPPLSPCLTLAPLYLHNLTYSGIAGTKHPLSKQRYHSRALTWMRGRPSQQTGSWNTTHTEGVWCLLQL